MYEDDYVRLKKSFNSSETNLAFTKSSTHTVIYITKFTLFASFYVRSKKEGNKKENKETIFFLLALYE